MQLLDEFLLDDPDRGVTAGRSMIGVGGVWLVFGAVGLIATGGRDAILHIGTAAAPASTLADMYPGWPTFWVPESLIGCLPAVLLVIAGVWIGRRARHLKRAYF